MILPKPLSALRVPYHIWKLKKSQYQRTSDLTKAQSKKLRKMVEHAYYHVPYYHFLFKNAKIHPRDIKSLTDLAKLPTVCKSEFVQNWGKFVSNTTNPGKCKIFTTSGSTGTPLRVLKDRVTEAIGYSLTYYMFFECGMHFDDRFLEATIAFPNLRECIFRHGPFNLMKGYYVSLVNDSAYIVKKIHKIKPDVIYSYPTTIEYLLEDFGDEMRDLNPKLLFTQGEMLTEKCRKLIEDTLNIIPSNTYGSREFPAIAFECDKHEGLHVLNDWIVLELMRDGEVVGPGEKGETVVTSLYNYAMPFLRYRLGDIASWEEDTCTCGRSWPLLKAIEGRVSDFITLPSGTRIQGTVVPVYLRRIPGVKRFQMIFQESKTRLLIKVVCDDNVQEEDMENLRGRLIHQARLACLNEDLNIEVSFVSAIPPQPSGKNPDLVVER